MAEERLQKLLARAGIDSRRGAEALVRAGRVRVNGRVAALGDRADPGRDEIAVNGEPLPLAARTVVVALHKPRGCVTTLKDPEGRPTIAALLPARPRLVPCGRLDMDSEGLLLCTNDGAFVLAVTHPGGGVRKRYRAWVRGQPTKAGLDALVRGVGLDDGPARALTVRVLPLARATRGLRLAPWQAPAGVVAVLEVVMGEGRKREVRRLLAAVGLPVVRLVRVAVGPVTLTGLRPGQYRYLSEREVAALREPRGHPPIPERH